MKSTFFLTRILFCAFAFCIFFACKKDDVTDNTIPLRFKEYPLVAYGKSGINGKVVITENKKDTTFDFLVKLDKSIKDTLHTFKVTYGDVNNPGGPVFLLTTSILGTGETGGIAYGLLSHVRQILLPNRSSKRISYDSVLVLNAHVDVRMSPHKPDSVLCKGNIGKN